MRAGFAFDYGDPVLLFEADQFSPGKLGRDYDIATDGRFLMTKVGSDRSSTFVVVENWFEELKGLVPAD